MTAREELAGYLDEHFRLAPPAPFALEPPLIPVTTPVAVELGKYLVPPEREETPLVTTHAPALRERIQADLGAAVPGIRFRAAAAGSQAWEYSIFIDEALSATGRVEPGLAYVPASAETLAQAGIPPGDTEPVWGTGTRPPGRWVRPDALPLLAQAGIDASVDSLVHVAAHVEAVLRDNMAAFLGVQEVDALLTEWSATEANATFIESIIPDTSARLRLTSILRALVGERVPITRWRDILEVVGAHADDDDLADVVRAVRLAVRDVLPGNDGATRRVAVPERCEVGIASGAAGSLLDSVPADAAADLLEFVRGEAGQRDHETALVVQRAELRRLVRRIVRAEFPSLAVLAADELEPEGEAHDAARAGSLATAGASIDA